jgi:rare lipoprotein A
MPMTAAARLAGFRSWPATATIALVAVSLAGCAQPPSQHAHGREFFSVARYGPASPRMVDDGEPVPRGGGQYLVGHPYTIAGRTYYPSENAHYSAVGLASWYGDAFHGRRTANGEIYDMRSLSAAHPTMPLPSYARVTNLCNGYSMIVRVNDRGPYSGGRIIDVSSRVADMLDIKSTGTARVKVDYVGPAPLAGSDDESLVASLRTDGKPATLEGSPASPTMVADAEPQQPPPQPRQAAAEPPREDGPPFVAAARPKLMKAPPPPARPFDLGEIARVLDTASAAPIPPPPRRPVMQASAGERTLYFADRETPALQMLRGDPFAGVVGADPR